MLASIIVIANFHYCYSQDTIDLRYDSKKKHFIENTESIKFKYGKTYQLRILNVNTSFIDSKIESKSYILSSSTPEILKPILPGISDEASVLEGFTKEDSLNLKGQLNEVYLETVRKYNNLKELKSNSDALYKWNLLKIESKKADSIKADSIKKIVLAIFAVDSLSDLKRKVNLSVKYVEIANELFKSKMEGIDIDKIIKNKIIDNYAEISHILEVIKSDNYLKYVNFIEKSLASKDNIMSKPFKAEKDLVDLNITLIDTYKPDTLYNSFVSFYTSGNLSFDFSTGFFYNNLYEESYYLEKRETDSLVNNVLKNDNCMFDVSFGALGHFSYKIKNNIKIGVSTGAAISPIDGKTRYLVGGSLLFGRKKQIGINGGWIFAKMKVLSNKVKSDELGKFVDIDVESVPTYDKTESGFYFGITYNLTSKKK